MSGDKGMPINRENAERLSTWASSLSGQARRALEANGPKVAAAFESMRRAMVRPGERADDDR